MAFTDQQLTDIRRFCGYPAWSGIGWAFDPGYAILAERTGMYPGTDMMSLAEETIVIAKLTNLTAVELATMAPPTLDSDSAGPWVHNPRELSDRFRWYQYWRKDLCQFIGCPPGEALRGSGSVVRC